MSNFSDLQGVLQTTANSLCDDMASAMGIKQDEYIIQVDNSLLEDYVIAIDAGFPPVVRVSIGYMAKSLFIVDDKERVRYMKALRRKLSLAMSKVPRQRRTLALVPIAESIALMADAKKFVRTMFPDKLHFKIPDNHIQTTVTITVTVREYITGMEVSLSGTNETYLRSKAIAQLTSLVADSEVLEQTLDHQKSVELPATILISDSATEDNVRYEY